jgi:hypothetical protein
MANEAMAQAVLEHAHRFYDVGDWYVVAECWDTWSVLEELEQHEAKTQVSFDLEAAAIGHFARLIAERRSLHGGLSPSRFRTPRCGNGPQWRDSLGLVIRSLSARKRPFPDCGDSPRPT